MNLRVINGTQLESMVAEEPKGSTKYDLSALRLIQSSSLLVNSLTTVSSPSLFF